MNIVIENKNSKLTKEDIQKCLVLVAKELMRFDFDFEEHKAKDIYVNVNNNAENYSISLEYDKKEIRLQLSITSEKYKEIKLK